MSLLDKAFTLVDDVHKNNTFIQFNLRRTFDHALGPGIKWEASFTSYMGMDDFKEWGRSVKATPEEAILDAVKKAKISLLKL